MEAWDIFQFICVDGLGLENIKVPYKVRADLGVIYMGIIKVIIGA